MPDIIPEMITRARAAQAEVEFWPQERVDEMVAAVGWQAFRREHAEACARLAIEETGMGVYEHKLAKHQKKTLGTLRDLHGLKTVGVIEEDPARGLLKIAKPVGVIAALTPMTNATSTICCNGLPMLKTRNAVIFAPHPRAKRSCKLTADFMREGLKQVGAPLDLIQYLEEPSIELTGELMKAVDLVVATGGTPMVKAAYSSGTPAYGVGAGNSVCIVDETADIADAAHKIFLSKTFDNATSCSTENSGVFQEAIFDRMVEALKSEGGYLCSMEEKAQTQSSHVAGWKASQPEDRRSACRGHRRPGRHPRPGEDQLPDGAGRGDRFAGSLLRREDLAGHHLVEIQGLSTRPSPMSTTSPPTAGAGIPAASTRPARSASSSLG